MRIAISTSVMQRGKSGVGQYILALVRALLTQPGEHKFVLLVLEEDMPLFQFAAGRAELVVVPEKYRPAIRNIFWHQFILPKLLKEHRVDVVHVPSYRRLMFHSPCPKVATIHDLAPFHVQGKYDVARMFYGRVVARLLARRQDAIIAISRNTACDVARFFGIPATQQNIIPNGIDHTRFNPGDVHAARRSVKERWNIEKPFFLFVSRLEHPAKNHVRLIQAFNRFKQSTRSDFVLALGGGDWHGAEFIRAEAARSPFAGDIRFLGFVPDDRLPDLYRAATGMVYPSLFEGFGLPPIEAMACGCPVMSSERGALAEVVADAADIIDPENIESLAAGLARMSDDGFHRDGLRQLGLRNAKRFNWDTNAKAVLALYAQVHRTT